MAQAKVEVYLTQTCPYCMMAKQLLSDKGVDFQTIDVTGNPELRATMTRLANGGTTVPQVFINDRPCGGFTDIYALEQSGQLDQLLESESEV
ncbi:glutaredoxin 3 [Pelagibaculum spongiae]|uniref:Glutaredoxin n=1 Tax=Pelagibaculum spongiae TaxID=2080658 RepID=A0A2V1H0D6_9GAMM|nr:glutaredoxin 3 [Pelagibaculum spongiae]PVZ68130.1 glutaredoxin 3 [Pelagibaculum spongiae]